MEVTVAPLDICLPVIFHPTSASLGYSHFFLPNLWLGALEIKTMVPIRCISRPRHFPTILSEKGDQLANRGNCRNAFSSVLKIRY
jgi:hypothetical protein